jgi:hypothetical protein
LSVHLGATTKITDIPRRIIHRNHSIRRVPATRLKEAIVIISHRNNTAVSALRAVFASSALLAFLAPMGCLATSPEGAEEDGDLATASDEVVTVGQDLAIGKPASQSSTYTGSSVSSAASNAVDGNLDTNFQNGSVTSTNNEASAWWQVDLQSSQSIGNVVVWNRTDCCSNRLANFNLLVSNDGVSWQSYPYPGTAPNQVSFVVNRFARYVKVQLNGTNLLSLAEVQVFPSTAVMGNAHCNDLVRVKSWKGDYLNRPNTVQGVTSDVAGAAGNEWTVECKPNGNVQLRSWKGDYLHRPDSPQGVTTWDQGEWTVVPSRGSTFMLRSWKGDYLHRPDSPQGVTTWDQGEWTVEIALPASFTMYPVSINALVNQKYVSALGGGASSLVAAAAAVDSWETFQFVDLGGGNVAIKALVNGRYVSAENAGSSPLIANRDAVGQWETFKWVSMSNSNEDFALRSAANGQYVSALNGGAAALTAAAAAPNTWETFRAKPTPAALAQRFAPKIWLHGQESYFPSSTGDFLPNVHDELIGGVHYYVTNQSLGCDSCTNPSFLVGKNPSQNQVPVYAEIVDRTEGGQATRVTDLIYWTFYPYNNGKRVCVGAYLPLGIGCAGGYSTFGNHVGDWEHMTVRLVDGQPSQVYLSQHSGGQTFNYGDPALQLSNGHPVVFAAQGSHGLYPDASRHTYQTLFNGDTLNDDTSAGVLWDTAASVVTFSPQVQTGSLAWLNYTGRWGNSASGCNVSLPISGECVLNAGPDSILTRSVSSQGFWGLE